MPIANRSWWKTGVYLIRNTVNNKVYVGSCSSLGIEWRISQHKRTLNLRTHYNKHLQRGWNKYGETSFEFSVLIRCSPESCLQQEQRFIDQFKATGPKFGYNIALVAGSSLGIKCSDETKEKLRQANLGKSNGPMSDETKIKLRQANLGKKLSDEHREKIRQTNLGKKDSIETKNKKAVAGRLRRHTDEEKKKIGEANKRRIWTEESRRKLSESKRHKNG